MNQILEYDTGKNNKSPKRGGSTSDKVVRVFAILLIIIAIALIASGGMSLLKNKKTSDSNVAVQKSAVEATIEVAKNEESDKVIISVSSEIEIDKLTYSWNSESEKTIAGNDSKTMEQEIPLPLGENTLIVKVTDKEGNSTTKEFNLYSENGQDLTKPEIVISITEATEENPEKRLLITATDETALSYITYRWNEDEEETVRADEDDPKKIEVEVEIPVGKNVITVTAIDTSNNANVSTEQLNGVKKPEITCVLSDDQTKLIVTCTHEGGIKSIYYTLNDKPYQALYEEGDYPTTVTFEQPLDEGYNRIILEVTSIEDAVATFDGECEYNPNTEPSDDSTNSTNNSNSNTTSSSDNATNTTTE